MNQLAMLVVSISNKFATMPCAENTLHIIILTKDVSY
jgi:hypothetical protein